MLQIYSEHSGESVIGNIKHETEKNYELTLPEVEETSVDHQLLSGLFDICGENFTKKNVFQSHMKKSDSELRFRCFKDCSQIFSSRSDLKIHMLQNHSIEPFQLLKCSECTDIFTTTNSLESHIRKNHTKDGKFSCNKCNFSAINYQNLFSHKIRNHQKSSKELKCQKCKREFQTLYDFNQHKKMHLISCSLCEKTFTHENQKLRHIRLDHGKFFCDKTIETLLK